MNTLAHPRPAVPGQPSVTLGVADARPDATGEVRR